ncbi:hypothetical protein FQA39_LY15443 [Lamprigera yunnana]|nr:hypothetical protein FQA39_LY15443 [Lamprigera yunnana]
MKAAVYRKLITKMKEMDPNADRASVRAKINTLRSSYCRELKKIGGSIRSGIGADDVYAPTLWYFADLNFLRDHETQVQDTSTMENTNENDDEIDKMNETKRKATTKNEETKRARLLDIACLRLHNFSSDSQIIAKAWGIDFDKMRPDQQLYAKKIIGDILFEGRLALTGIGDRKRALGGHLASETLGSKTSRMLSALHVVTGCDSISKIGTKKYSFGALKKFEPSVDASQLLHEIDLNS